MTYRVKIELQNIPTAFELVVKHLSGETVLREPGDTAEVNGYGLSEVTFTERRKES